VGSALAALAGTAVLAVLLIAMSVLGLPWLAFAVIPLLLAVLFLAEGPGQLSWLVPIGAVVAIAAIVQLIG
jgi:hypothetical protein